MTQRLWQRLDDESRREFLGGAMRRWDRVRHRIDPALYDWLEQRRNEGSLVVHAASITEAAAGPEHVRVALSNGRVISAAAVLNCTGTCTGVSSSPDPLVLNVLSSGLAQAGPLDLGFDTDEAGRCCRDPVRCRLCGRIGTLRRGQLWESTAIPEIRAQAAALAPEILATLPGPTAQRRPRDPYGLPISASTAAAAGYVGALQRILRVQSGAETLLEQVVRDDPGFALGHAVRALLGVEWGVDVDVEAALQAAESTGARADERERQFIEVARARVHEPGASSAAALLSYIRAYPEDALAVSLAVPTIAFGGATEIPTEAWALVEGLAPAYRDDWWYLGMLAFIRQEQDRFAEAAELSSRALLLEPTAGHAVHAKAHVHYETGDHAAGLRWLDSWIQTCGAPGRRTGRTSPGTPRFTNSRWATPLPCWIGTALSCRRRRSAESEPWWTRRRCSGASRSPAPPSMPPRRRCSPPSPQSFSKRRPRRSSAYTQRSRSRQPTTAAVSLDCVGSVQPVANRRSWTPSRRSPTHSPMSCTATSTEPRRGCRDWRTWSPSGGAQPNARSSRTHCCIAPCAQAGPIWRA